MDAASAKTRGERAAPAPPPAVLGRNAPLVPVDSAESRARGVAAITRSVDLAKQLGCGALLLYPGRLGSGARLDVGYETTWERFTTELKKCIPAAESAKVYLNPENVWNKFLMSPLEFAAFTRSEKERWGNIIRRANIKLE